MEGPVEKVAMVSYNIFFFLKHLGLLVTRVTVL